MLTLGDSTFNHLLNGINDRRRLVSLNVAPDILCQEEFAVRYSPQKLSMLIHPEL
jgi:hypothetical protein